MKKVWYGNIVLPNSLLRNGQITVEDGRIVYVGERKTNEKVAQIVEWQEGYIWPGLIDLHVHGAGGADVMDCSDDALSIIANTLLKYGVTGFLATTITTEKEHLREVIQTITKWKHSKGKAEVLGIHMEGPWLNTKYKGAQNPKNIHVPKKGDGEWVYSISKGYLKVVTLAPEIANGLEILEELVKLGVIVSIGHTNASYENVEKAVELGATHITHTFNAMSGFHHRKPGVAVAALAIKNLYCELIVDGYHVHPKVVDLLIKLKNPEKILLVSDSMRAIDMPDGEYDLGGLKVSTKKGKAMLIDGTLSGSLLTLNHSVLNAMQFSNIPIWEAVKMASLNPASRLGLEREIGSIEVGKRANLVAVNTNGEVEQVWMDGVEQYKRNNEE